MDEPKVIVDEAKNVEAALRKAGHDVIRDSTVAVVDPGVVSPAKHPFTYTMVDPKRNEEAKYRLAYKLAKRSHKRLARAQYQGERDRQAAGGYCCPRCQTWHPTPEARKVCRESHRG